MELTRNADAEIAKRLLEHKPDTDAAIAQGRVLYSTAHNIQTYSAYSIWVESIKRALIDLLSTSRPANVRVLVTFDPQPKVDVPEIDYY